MKKEIVRLIVRLLMTSTSPGTSSAATSSMHSLFHVNLFPLVITSSVRYAPLFLKRMFSLGLFFFRSKCQDLAEGLKAVFTLLLSLIPPGWYVPLPLLSACVSLSLTSESSLRAPWWVTAQSGAGATQQGSQQCGTSSFFTIVHGHTYTHTHITFSEGD